MTITITISTTDKTEDERAIRAAVCEAYKMGWKQAIKCAAEPYENYLGPDEGINKLFKIIANNISSIHAPEQNP